MGQFTTYNIGRQITLSLHQNIPTHLLRKTSGVPRPVSSNYFELYIDDHLNLFGLFKMDYNKLDKIGWTEVNGISCPEDLIEIGKELGTLIRGPNDELIKKIVRKRKEESLNGSQSSLYGFGSFPLHTDTVFWPLPSKYVIFHAVGDVRRPTTLKKLSDLIPTKSNNLINLAKRSVWSVGPPSKRFYCSMMFNFKGNHFLRYDSDLMTPQNAEAKEIHEIMKSLVFTENTEIIKWTGSNAIIINNWISLHGRGPQPVEEDNRIIYRLYVG